MLTRHKRVVVKPNRSAGGYQLRFVTRTEPWSAPGPLSGEWVVEEHLDAARSLSVQTDVRKTGPRVMFCGEMHTTGGAYDGYFSPVEESTDATTKELTQWASALGSHLAGHGYAGSCGIDAGLDPRGQLFATESNVRRTATTAPHALVERLSRAAGLRKPAWLLATGGREHHIPSPRSLSCYRRQGWPGHRAGPKELCCTGTRPPTAKPGPTP